MALHRSRLAPGTTRLFIVLDFHAWRAETGGKPISEVIKQSSVCEVNDHLQILIFILINGGQWKMEYHLSQCCHPCSPSDVPEEQGHFA